MEDRRQTQGSYIFVCFLNIILILFLKKDVVLHNLNKMNLLTSMSHSPTYQQVVLGKIKSEKAKKKKNRIPVNSETIKYEREKKEMNETFRKKKRKEKVIIESKTLTDLWANLRKPGKPPASRNT